MNYHILVEGPDNVGKSTQIQNIKNYFNNIVFVTLSHGNTKQLCVNDYIEYNTALFRSMFETISNNDYIEVSTICDRSHIGEMVYAPIFRNYDGDYVLNIEEEYSDIDNLILIMYVDEPQNLISREDGQSFSTDIDVKWEEVRRFKEAFEKCNLKKILISITDKTEKEVSNETITKILEITKDLND